MSDPEIISQTSRYIYRGPRYYLGVQDNCVGPQDHRVSICLSGGPSYYVGPQDTPRYYLGV